MRRWLIAAAFVLLPALFLLRLPGRQRVLFDEAPFDEILAYELSPSQSVTVTVPGGLDSLLLTTWAIAPPQSGRDPEAKVPYSFEVGLLDPEGTPKEARTYHVESRISGGQRPQEPFFPYIARLADSDDCVTDPRTTAVDRSATLSRGGFLRVTNRESGGALLLLRLSFRDPRGTIARTVSEASLTLEARRHVVANRTSLGFVDLEQAARQAGLAATGTRLSAVGREGFDYTLRRLLLGDYRGGGTVTPRPDLGFDLSDSHWAAMNFGGPVTLRFVALPHQRFRLREGGSDERWISTNESGVVEAALSGNRPRTVVLGSDRPTDLHVRCLVDRDGARAQIGDVRTAWAEDGRYEIGEDLHTTRFARLDANVPVVARVVPGQRALRVMVRGEATSSETSVVDAMVEARFQAPGGQEQTAAFHATLLRSKFDRWRPVAGSVPLVSDATDSYSESLELPSGVEEVRLYGSPAVWVKLFVPEPDVASDELRLPYRVALADQEVWRNAPYDVRSWAPIAPENEMELEQANRVADLVAQARIEQRGVGLAARPERLLPPEGAPVRRTLLVAAPYAPADPLPLDAWSRVEAGRAIRVDATGPRAGRIEVTYHAGADRLGQPIRLLVDGSEAARRMLVVGSGVIRADLPPGKHNVEVDGLGSGAAYVDAAPERGGAIVRRRDVYELTRRSPLEFRFEQKTSEILHAVIFVATEGQDRSFRLRYKIDDGRVARGPGRFFRVTTIPEAEIDGKTGDLGKGLLWEASNLSSSADGEDPSFSHGIGSAKIHVGDDLPAGIRRIRLSLDPLSDPVWVRVVLVGQGEAPGESDTRTWAAEAM